VAEDAPHLPLEFIASVDPEIERLQREDGRTRFSWLLTFDKLLGETRFAPDMMEMLQTLERAYDYPVDVEFTANRASDGEFHINLVQCRPLQVRSGSMNVTIPDVPRPDVLLEAHGAVIGRSRSETIDRVLYVPPEVYGNLPLQKKYQVARLIGQIMRLEESPEPGRIMLVGPGRWGTTTPSLGIPVNFAEVNRASVLCEIVAMRDGLVPDVSLGTHFFNELVEMDVLYLALFPGAEGNFLNGEFFTNAPNRFEELLPGENGLSEAVRVIDLAKVPGAPVLRLNADTPAQKVLCHLEHREAEAAHTQD